MRLLLILLGLALPAVGGAQPLSISASVAVAWINPLGVPDYRGENPPSVGMVSHPTLVVLWRGQPGWALTASGGRVGFGDGGPDGDELHSIVVEHGGIRLELQYDLQGGSAAVNGMPVPLPDGHDVILLDRVDREPVVAGTLRVGGQVLEPIETFLGRSPEVREYVRCGTPLPEDVFAGEAEPELAERFRDFMQAMLDERCRLLAGG